MNQNDNQLADCYFLKEKKTSRGTKTSSEKKTSRGKQNSIPGNTINLLTACLVLVSILSACQQRITWTDTYKQAEHAYKQGNNEQAIKLYTQAVKELNEQGQGSVHDSAQEIELKSLNKLSICYLQKGSSKEAERWGRRALALAERVYGPSDINLMPHLIQMQRVFEADRNKDEAGKYMIRIIEVQEARTGPESVPMMWLLDQYARSRSPSCGQDFDRARLRQLVRLREKFASKDDLVTLQDKMILAGSLFSQPKAGINESSQDKSLPNNSSKYNTDKDKSTPNNSAPDKSSPNQTRETDISEATELYEFCLQAARQKQPGFLPTILFNYGRAIKSVNAAKATTMLQEAWQLSSGEKYNQTLTPDIASELGYLLESQNKKGEAQKVYSQMIAELNKRESTAKLEYFEDCLKRSKL